MDPCEVCVFTSSEGCEINKGCSGDCQPCKQRYTRTGEGYDKPVMCDPMKLCAESPSFDRGYYNWFASLGESSAPSRLVRGIG